MVGYDTGSVFHSPKDQCSPLLDWAVSISSDLLPNSVWNSYHIIMGHVPENLAVKIRLGGGIAKASGT